MKKTTLTLSLMLAVSGMLNLALLRREPPAGPAPAVRPSSPQDAPPPPAAPGSSSPAKVRTAETETDVLFLREEVRKLREQLTVANARRGLARHLFDFSDDDAAELPEVLEFSALLEHLGSLDRQGEALRLLEEYAGLEGPLRTSFRDLAQSALAAYLRITKAFEGEQRVASRAAENDEFFEDNDVRRQAIMDRMTRRTEEWMRDHVHPLRDLLNRRDGVRPTLLSHHLPRLLMQLAVADDR